MEDRYDEFIEIVKNKKLITNYIGPEEELNAMKKRTRHIQALYTEQSKDYPKGLLNTVIRGDSVVVYSFAKPSALVYVIKSETVVQNYKQFFYDALEYGGDQSIKDELSTGCPLQCPLLEYDCQRTRCTFSLFPISAPNEVPANAPRRSATQAPHGTVFHVKALTS